MTTNPVKAKKAFYIKLGSRGSWERSAIKDGFLRLGYDHVPHDLCLKRRWNEIRSTFNSNTDSGTITRHINQVRHFYESTEDTIWITFHADSLWWCQAKAPVVLLKDGSKRRDAINGWSNFDLLGNRLTKSLVSGKLLAVEGFRGTICSISELGYLLNKINGTLEPHVQNARTDLDRLVNSIIPVIKNLHFKDFEILIDLIFRQSGWQRVGVTGATVKDIDLDLISPITRERIAVQIKSRASLQQFNEYSERLGQMDSYSRIYFVTHSPNRDLINQHETFEGELELWTPEIVAKHTVNSGLVEWILDKAS